MRNLDRFTKEELARKLQAMHRRAQRAEGRADALKRRLTTETGYLRDEIVFMRGQIDKLLDRSALLTRLHEEACCELVRLKWPGLTTSDVIRFGHHMALVMILEAKK